MDGLNLLLLQKFVLRNFPWSHPGRRSNLCSESNKPLKNWGKLTQKSADLLAESVNTRQLYSELGKITLLQAANKPVDVDTVAQLVRANTSLQLAAAIKAGNTVRALGLLNWLTIWTSFKIVATDWTISPGYGSSWWWRQDRMIELLLKLLKLATQSVSTSSRSQDSFCTATRLNVTFATRTRSQP